MASARLTRPGVSPNRTQQVSSQSAVLQLRSAPPISATRCTHRSSDALRLLADSGRMLGHLLRSMKTGQKTSRDPRKRHPAPTTQIHTWVRPELASCPATTIGIGNCDNPGSTELDSIENRLACGPKYDDAYNHQGYYTTYPDIETQSNHGSDSLPSSHTGEKDSLPSSHTGEKDSLPSSHTGEKDSDTDAPSPGLTLDKDTPFFPDYAADETGISDYGYDSDDGASIMYAEDYWTWDKEEGEFFHTDEDGIRVVLPDEFD